MKDSLYQKIKKMEEQHEMFLIIENLLNEDIVRKMKKYCKKRGYNLRNNNFLSCYEELYNTEFKDFFDALLLKNKLRYSNSIRNSISYLLSKKEEIDFFLKPSSLPGINEILNINDTFYINTILGEIHVKKASDVFEHTDSKEIFNRTLSGYCYEVCYEFLQKNPDYQVVFSWMPNLFVGGHYHVYLKNKTCVLDLASNAYYEDKTYKIPLKGKIFKIATTKDIAKDLQNILDIWEDELFLLSHYYDNINHHNLKLSKK